MAWTEKLPGGGYAARFRDKTGTIQRAHGGPWTHKAEALRHGNQQEADARQPGWKDPSRGRTTWGDWCAAWWPTRTIEESTRVNDTYTRDLYLLPHWRDVELAEITRFDVKAWIAELREKNLANATIHKIVHLFGASLTGAIDAEIIDVNPTSRLGLAGSPPALERFLTRDEAFRLLAELKAHADPTHHDLVQFLLGTGMRFGEAIATHHNRIDRERQSVDVVEAASKHARIIKPYPKSRRRRTVPLPTWVSLPADPHRATCGLDHAGGVCRSGLVFSRRDGTLVEYSWFQRAFTRAWQGAEIGPVRIHDLRHTYASWLLQEGVSLAEVGRLLGHTSPMTTARYAHLAQVDVGGILQALGEPLRRAEIEHRNAETRLQTPTGDSVVYLSEWRNTVQ